jgi:anaerobic magnesium-protoporphyrin IX monomethyl ester cyclase
MKPMIITTPIRPVPTLYPPLASLSIMTYLRRNGYPGAEFYNIDGNRPSFHEAVEYIVAQKPDVLGVSAVVSTAYAYTKKLTLLIKQRLPNILIVVGGNLAASAEVLLRKTGADICVNGEGEKVFHQIVETAETTQDLSKFKDIPGLVFLNESNELVNTGYPVSLSKEEIFEIDWDILDESSDIDLFVTKLTLHDDLLANYAHVPAALDPEHLKKRFMLLPASKGCVAKCTFCHRWDKGIRYVPPDLYIDRVKNLIDRYDIGYMSIADENFGTDRRWLKDFCAQIKPLNLFWTVAGMRVNCITPEQIEMMKDAGCVMILYGMETGSPRILEVMEKKTKISDNENAMQWTVEAGLFTVVQLVLGMPGETPETIGETIEFCKKALTISPSQNPNLLSINYAQALPGTPLYEFARRTGRIGRSLDDEEQYLISVSDKDAHDEQTTNNFTGYPTLEHQSWRPRITIETNFAFIQKFGLDRYYENLFSDGKFFEQKKEDRGYFANPKRLVDTSLTSDSVHGVKTKYKLDESKPSVPKLWRLLCSGQLGLAMICHPIIFFRLRWLLPLMVSIKNLRQQPIWHVLESLGEYIAWKLRLAGRRGQFAHQYTSLRRIVDKELASVPGDLAEMAALRKGR